MSIVKTEAFVLKSFKYGETSKIVTLFTEDYGKLTVIVKGARNYKSRLCGTLESMNYIRAVIYLKENRELQLLSNAEYKKSFTDILSSFEKLESAYKIIEILNISLLDRDSNKLLFNLLMNTFSNLNDARKNYMIYVLHFQMKFAKILGIGTEFYPKESNNETFLPLTEVYQNKSQLNYLSRFDEYKIENIKDLEIDNNTIRKLIQTFENLLTCQTFEYNRCKSTKVFQELNT